jgi:hypothetical protein
MQLAPRADGWRSTADLSFTEADLALQLATKGYFTLYKKATPFPICVIYIIVSTPAA